MAKKQHHYSSGVQWTKQERGSFNTMSYYIELDGCTKVAVAILSDNLTMCRQEEWTAPDPEQIEE